MSNRNFVKVPDFIELAKMVLKLVKQVEVLTEQLARIEQYTKEKSDVQPS